MELNDICSVEEGAGRKRYDVVLWSPDGARVTLESFGRREEAQAHATRVATAVAAWITEAH